MKSGMSHPVYEIIDNARKALQKWAEDSGIVIYRIELVAAFESLSDIHAIWIFYPSNRDLDDFKKNGTSETVKQQYLQELKFYDFPFAEFPRVIFEFDSDENVRKSYAGSYFLRLR